MESHNSYQESKLIRSFIEQVNRVGYESISVKSLTNAAGVNRTQFYQFFSGKADLAEYICSTYLDRFNKLLAESIKYTNRAELRYRLGKAFDDMKLHASMIRALWAIEDRNFSPYLIMQNGMRGTILSCVSSSYQAETMHLQMFSSTFAASAMATIRLFLDNECRDQDLIIEDICTCVLDGMDKLLSSS